MSSHDLPSLKGAKPIDPSVALKHPRAPIAPSEETVSMQTWLAVIASTIGAFLAILNIQVVNSSLADIQGAIGAGIDTGGWISTAYLISEIIVIPLAGWFAQIFSLRTYLLVSGALFLVFSVTCAAAGSLPEMIALRAFQGFFGGVLIPMSFTIIMTKLPRAKQPIGLALFAFSATFAPAIGPTIGGWLNDNFGWEYIFYVNLIPGAIMLAMLWISLEKAPMQLGLLKTGDWPGIATMAVGLAALQTMLEEGNRNDWFGSRMIVWLAITAAVALSAFLWIELKSKSPLVNLRLLGDRNFGLGTVSAALLGVLLYGTVFVVPLYLSQTQGYNAMQIGEVLAWTGLPQLLIIPFVPALMKRVDARVIVAVGFGLFALSNFLNIHLTRLVAADELLVPNIIRAVGQALLLTPITALATARIAPKDAASASALFNMMRNLGGAVGIAALQTFLTKREQFHSNVLTPSVSLLGEATRQRISRLTDYFLSHGVSDPATATHQAIIAVGRTVRTQATVMSYSDTFIVFGVSALIALVICLFMKRPGASQAAAAH